VLFSIIIPVHNSESILDECLGAIFNCDEKDYEVIVVDDGSTDNSMEIAKKFPCRIVALKPGWGPAAARNRGVKDAEGEIVLFIDSDVVIPKDALYKIKVQFSQNRTVIGVSGVYALYNRFDNFLSQYKHLVVYYRENICGEILQDSFKAAFVAFKREIFKTFKFDEMFRDASIEDLEFGRKLIASGYNLILDKSNEVEHVKEFNTKTFFNNQYNRSRDLIKTYTDKKARNFYYSKKRKNHYQKMYVLRVPLSWLAICALLLFSITMNCLFLLVPFLGLSTAVFIERDFLRFCLFKKGTAFVLKCIIIYFADGFVSGLGVLRGLFDMVIQAVGRIK